VCEEEPLEAGDEGGAETADGQDDRPDQSAYLVTTVAEHPDEAHRYRRAGERYTERQRSDPV